LPFFELLTAKRLGKNASTYSFDRSLSVLVRVIRGFPGKSEANFRSHKSFPQIALSA
jgi:hypothetical protein